jgi:hypothetical protein
MSDAPDPIPVDPNEEPDVIRPSATGLVVPDTDPEAAGDDEPA